MKKEDFYDSLRYAGENSIFRLKWDRGNGSIERFVSFDGFDSKGEPLLKLKDSKDYLNVRLIGGYDSIISLQDCSADGMC